MHNVKNAQAKRLEAWQQDPDWINLMSIRLLLLKEPYFRWFDSGDLQSTKMLEDINQVAKNTELTTKHWLPTQERKVVFVLKDKADNLTIRVSSPATNVPLKTDDYASSFVSLEYIEESDFIYQCPSSKQENQCGSCRACWDPNNKVIAYLQH